MDLSESRSAGLVNSSPIPKGLKGWEDIPKLGIIFSFLLKA